MKAVKAVFAAILLGHCLACSPASVLSSEGAIGGLVGGAAGTGVGYLIGEQIGKKPENMLLAGSIGSGLGLMAGGMLYERNLVAVKEKQIILRQARRVSEQQREIDRIRQQMHDSSSWGQMERKPWNERYWGDSYNSPYEGSSAR